MSCGDDITHYNYTYFEGIIYKINLLNNSLTILESEGYDISSFKDELNSIYFRISDSIKTNNFDPYTRNEIISDYYNLESRIFFIIKKEPNIALSAAL